MSRLRLTLLGGFRLWVGDEERSVSSRKGRALLAYLALRPGCRATRSELANLLWENGSDRTARQNLRQALVRLRDDLGPAADRLMAGAEMVELAIASEEVDALRFLQLAEGGGDTHQAAALYGGPFLGQLSLGSNTVEEWLRFERGRIAAAAETVFAAEVRRLDAAGQGEEAIVAAERLFGFDTLREDWHRLLLRLYAKYRGREAALARGRGLSELLKAELDVAPENETKELLDGIRRAGRVANAEPEVLAPASHEAEGPRGSPPPIPSEPTRSRPLWRSRAGFLAISAAGLIAICGVGGLLLWSHMRPPGQTTAANPRDFGNDEWRSPPLEIRDGPRSSRANARVIPMVVLPFASEDGDPSGAALANSITDDLTNLLSRVSPLRVISRNTSHAFRGKQTDPAGLARELGVRLALNGTVRVRGGAVRVNVELIDTHTRLAIWSDQIDRELGNPNVIENEIVLRIGRALHVQTRSMEVRVVGGKPDEVQQLVDRGWARLGDGADLKMLEEAKALFEQALQKDPGSTRARMGIAVYHIETVSELLASDPVGSTQTAVRILQEVIERERQSADAHYLLGRAQRNANNFNEALISFQRALELNPSFTFAHAQVGLTLMFLRRPDEAVQHIRYAIRLSPKDPQLPFWLRFAAEAELDRGNYSQAVSDIQRSLEMLPRQLRGWGVLVAARMLSGDVAGSQKGIARLRQVGSAYSDDELLARIGRLSRLGPNRLHEGLKIALEISRHDQGAIVSGSN